MTRIKIFSLTLLSLTLCACGLVERTNDSSNTSYVQSDECFYPDEDGVIVMEAESVAPNGWSFETDFDDYQGSGYYCERSGSVESELVFNFVVPEAGDYRLSVRNYQDGDSHQSNDAWSEMNDFGQIKIFTHAVYACEGGSSEDCGFSWNTGLDNHYGDSINLMPGDHPNDEVPEGEYAHFVKPAGYKLSAGKHTFHMRARSQGYCIDRLHIYPDSMLSTNKAKRARDLKKAESPIKSCP